MSKFKVGDKVRCIPPPEGVKHENIGGAGWKLGGEFIIGRITEGDITEGDICWPRANTDGFTTGRGVYEDCLELAHPKVNPKELGNWMVKL